MYRFLKGSFFCVLALLIGAKTGVLMVEYFPGFAVELASIFTEAEGRYYTIEDEFISCQVVDSNGQCVYATQGTESVGCDHRLNALFDDTEE